MPKYTMLFELKFREVIKAISGYDKVCYRHGVWNPYILTDTKSVIKSIEKSGYGVDLRRDDSTGMYYVSIPSDGDMW